MARTDWFMHERFRIFILLLLTIFTASIQAAEPTPLHWTDRRPVAQLFISQQAQVTTMNPSGYLNAGVDVTTDTGRKAFHSQLQTS